METKVTIICVAYNHEKYIRQALESFIMQETSFDYEILVHDDASSDSTATIIQEYAAKYPKIIKPILEKENQYSVSGCKFLNEMYYAAQGEYIALCDGDDFWTDSLKLQRQVELMDSQTNLSLSFHAVNISYENAKDKDRVSPVAENNHRFTIKDILEDNPINTCSVMYRRQSYKDLPDFIMPHDVYTHLLHAKSGEIGFLDIVMATYRKQSGGLWWNSGERMERIYQKHYYKLTNLFAELLKLFNTQARYRNIIYKHIDYLINTFIDIDRKKKTQLLKEVTHSFPNLVARFTANQKSFINELQTENQRLSKDVHELLPAARELENIKKSRWYRLNPRHLKNK